MTESDPGCGLAQATANYEGSATVTGVGSRPEWSNFSVDLRCITCGMQWLGREVKNQATEQQAIDTVRSVGIYSCPKQRPW